MPNEQELCQRLDLVTTTLSTNIRTLSVGLLAFTSGLLLTAIGFTKDSTVQKIPSWFELRLLYVAALALLVLLFDVLQYLSLYFNTRNTLQELEKKIKKELNVKPHTNPREVTVPYNTGLLFKGGLIFFSLKIIVLIWATVWLVGSAGQLAYQGL